MWWIVGVVAAVALVATYLTWTAGRIDRLHGRATASAAALDKALERRTAAALAIADELDRPGIRDLAGATVDARAAQLAYAASAADRPRTPWRPDSEDRILAADREGAENALTKALREIPMDTTPPTETRDEVVASSRLVSLARHIHNDLVRDALAQRRRRLVRLMGMARVVRRHPEPSYFDIEDPILDA
jgi:hypothetical protein